MGGRSIVIVRPSTTPSTVRWAPFRTEQGEHAARRNLEVENARTTRDLAYPRSARRGAPISPLNRAADGFARREERRVSIGRRGPPTLYPVNSEGLVKMSGGVPLWGVVEGSGRPIVLCHGGPGLWDYLGDVAAQLCGDFTVHRWDQRGCGRSGSAPVYGLDAALRDVQELKLAWGVEDRWGIVGHSWGAYLALLTAVVHPDSTGAVVYVSGTGTPSWWHEVGSARHRAERARRLSPVARERLANLGSIDRSSAAEIEFRRLSWAPDFANHDPPPAALEEMATSPLPINWELNRVLARAELFDEEQLLLACERCDVPCLFVHGSVDPTRPRCSPPGRPVAERQLHRDRWGGSPPLGRAPPRVQRSPTGLPPGRSLTMPAASPMIGSPWPSGSMRHAGEARFGSELPDLRSALVPHKRSG